MFNEQKSYPSEDQKVADFLKLLDDRKPLKMFDHSDSSQKTNNALEKFHQMRDSHNALSDTMSASLLLQRSSTPARQSTTMPAASYSPSSSPGKPVSPYAPHTPAVPSRLSAGQTAVYSSRHHDQPKFTSPKRTSKSTSHNDDQSATTSPLDIPAPSPRPFPTTRQNAYQSNSADFEGPVYGPTSASVDSPLSLSKLAELRIASEEDLPGRATVDNSPEASREEERGVSETERNVQRGGFAGGLTGSGSSSFRGRVHRGNGRAANYTPPGGSVSYQHGEVGGSSERLPLGRRTPSYVRFGFGEEEDLLFAMSDMSSARRSMDQERSGDHNDNTRSSDSTSSGNPQRFSRGSPGGGGGGGNPGAGRHRWG